MIKPGSLCAFQNHLANRLAGANDQSAAGLLGLVSGSDYWLLPLSDSGEVVPLPALTPVPLTAPWFAGIANIRGDLYSVTDFSAFRGQAATPHTARSRLLLIGNRYGSNSALLVNGMLGLRNIDDLTTTPTQSGGSDWAQQTFLDKESRRWTMLNVAALLADDRFMNIGN